MANKATDDAPIEATDAPLGAEADPGVGDPNPVTDAVTQANVKVMAEAPAMAMGSLYQSASHATGILYENATNSQHNTNIIAQAATTQAVAVLYTLAGADVKPNKGGKS